MKTNRNDFLTAILSNITVVIQIIAVGAIGLSNVLQIQELFQLNELINITNFAILLLSFSFIGTYNFFRSNRDFSFNNNKKSWISKTKERLFGESDMFTVATKGTKLMLIVLYIVVTFSTLLFIYSTYKVSIPAAGVNFTTDGLLQIFTYATALISGSVILYIWINDSIEKSKQFTEEDFIPNFKDSLIKYNFLKTPTVQIKRNTYINTTNTRIINVSIEPEAELRYFETNYNGSIIHREFSNEEYREIFEVRD